MSMDVGPDPAFAASPSSQSSLSRPDGLQSGVLACRDAQRQDGITLFRKRPTVIEAVRVNAADFNGRDWDGFPFDARPEWLLLALESGELRPGTPNCTDYAEWAIDTREGTVWAGPDDWIVRGVHGELYPCGGEIFETLHDPALAAGTRRAETSETSARAEGCQSGDAEQRNARKDIP